MNPRLEELIQKFKNDPVAFAEKFLGIKLFEYQKRLVRDRNKRIVARFCRQSGKTLSFGVKILWFAITHPNVTVVVVSPCLRQSRNVRDKIEPLIMAIPKPIRKIIFKKIQREQIYLRNGSKIKFFPNSPDLIRGETADLIFVDEAAMFREDRYLFNNVLKPMLATTERKGYGYLYVASTPKNKRSMFYEICQPGSGFSHHHVSWREPVQEGLISRDFIEEMKKELLPAEFQAEFEAEFVDDADSWLPYDLIANCIDPYLEYYSFEACLEGEFYMGVDLGKYQDHSVVAVIKREGENLKLVHLHQFPLKTSYTAVIGYVKALCEKYDYVNAVYVDQTGIGEYVVEDMRKSFIPGVKGVVLTLNQKEEIMTFLKQKMINKQLAIPYDEGLISELNVEKFEITHDGHLKFSHPEGTHDDRLWALALATYATKKSKEKTIFL